LPELTGVASGFAARVSAALGSIPDASATGADSRAMWAVLGDAGVLDALYAGSPGDRSASHAPRPDHLAELLTVLDARLPVGVVLAACVQVATALPILREHAGSGPAAAAYESALRGESVLALAATDTRGAGSDLMRLGTTARLADDHLVLDGEKRWITNACNADYALVLARHRPQRHFTSFLWILVPTNAPGVHSSPVGGPLLAGSQTGLLRFREVVLGRDHVLGSPGRGLATFARHVVTERLAGGLWAGAMCRRILADTRRQLTARPLGDAPMWDNPAIRQRFARCLVDAWRIDAACDAYRAAHGGPDAFVSSMLLKTAVAESLDAVLTECAQLIGADAFAANGLAQLRAQAGMFGIAGGAAGAMLAGIADHAADLLETRSR
jgi:acyl-CoA dehydrogenase